MELSADSPEARRLRQAFEMYELGVRMMRQTLRRRHPKESDEQIEERVRAWLHERPGAEHGDAEGRPIPWPRTTKPGPKRKKSVAKRKAAPSTMRSRK